MNQRTIDGEILLRIARGSLAEALGVGPEPIDPGTCPGCASRAPPS